MSINASSSAVLAPPRVRACLFDMDGLLLDTEDLYTAVLNVMLKEHGKPELPWTVKSRMQGKVASESQSIFQEWAQLPLSDDQFRAQRDALQEELFPNARPLPGVTDLLNRIHSTTSPHIHMALASSACQRRYNLKTRDNKHVFTVFADENRVLGDDPRIIPGRGKPCPDIFQLALRTINEKIMASGSGEALIKPAECLVFEDGVPGVEAARRAGMQVVWCPHPGLLGQYEDRVNQVLAAQCGTNHLRDGDVDAGPAAQIDDGWARFVPTLVGFPFHLYGLDEAGELAVNEYECQSSRESSADVDSVLGN